jgi:hypothetical protein
VNFSIGYLLESKIRSTQFQIQNFVQAVEEFEEWLGEMREISIPESVLKAESL